MARTALRSRSRDDEDIRDDEEPRSSRRRDEDEAPATARRRRPVRTDEEPEDDEADRPRRSRSLADDDAEETPRRRRRTEDDDDERPRERSKSSVRRSSGGFDSFDKAKAQGSGKYPERFKPEVDEEKIVKFRDKVPFTSVFQHWINKKPYTCIADDEGEGCPLCDKGDVAQGQWYFHVIDMSETKPVLKVWQAGMRPTGLIKKINEKGKLAPVDREDLYFMVTKPDNNSFTISAIKERDLDEEWGVDPLTEKQIAAFDERRWDDSIIYEPTKDELRKAARLLTDADD